MSLYLSKPWSGVDTKYSIHRAQHRPCSASTQDSLFSLHTYNFELTPDCNFSFQHVSLQDRPPLASSPWALQGKVTLSHSHSWESTNWWICLISTRWASQRPPPCSPIISLDHGLQAHLQSCSITAPGCIYTFTALCAITVSQNSLQYGLQVGMIIAYKCIAKCTGLWHPSTSLSLLDCHFPVQLNPLWSTACSQSTYTMCRWVAIQIYTYIDT